MNRPWHEFALLAVLSLVAIGTPACSRQEPSCDQPHAAYPVDAQLLAFLSRSRSAHHAADLKEDKEPRAAIQALNSIVEGPRPGPSATPPAEAREVLADTQARIAELMSRISQFDLALEHVAAGLVLVPETSYFRGHLFETRGIVEQRRAEELSKAGKTVESDAAKARALAAFETAMQIQAEVIQNTPPDPASVPSGGASVPVLPSAERGEIR